MVLKVKDSKVLIEYILMQEPESFFRKEVFDLTCNIKVEKKANKIYKISTRRKGGGYYYAKQTNDINEVYMFIKKHTKHR